MHLLNVTTLKLDTFYGDAVPPYVILSHTWGEGEVTFADIQNPASPTTRGRAGFDKIRRTCQQAIIDRCQYAWVDTCCIDKSSSAELTEAINSMFKWYQDSQQCYAYLSDVSEYNFVDKFPRSRWFTRGWTLQELLAPPSVTFYDQDWHHVGTRRDHAASISEITGIDINALNRVQLQGGQFSAGLGRFCVAKRMSWASRRQTTRVEDIAYCLLGIFGVNMPLLYGEGKRAFVRLQEEIIKNYDDDSILAWGLDTETRDYPDLMFHTVAEFFSEVCQTSSILASSPDDFENCHGLQHAARSPASFMMTNLGLQIELPFVAVHKPFSSHEHSSPDDVGEWIGLLSCSTGVPTQFLGIVLSTASQKGQSIANVRRIQSGYVPIIQTVLVGPRTAARAVRKKVTIIQKNERLVDWDHFYLSRLFIINESNALLGSGYSVYRASVINMEKNFPYHFHKSWDSTAKVFTLHGMYHFKGLLQFEFRFKNITLEYTFSVFIRDGNAIVRNGVYFSTLEEQNFYDLLANDSIRGDEHQGDVHRGDVHEEGDEQDVITRRVVVNVKRNEVSSSQIFEVDVDLIEDIYDTLGPSAEIEE
jgi:hypothetical protein